MTRRSTAIAGAAALAIASLTAAPAANAAETLALAPSAGAEYAALTTSSFVLDAGYGGTESTAAQGALKFRVINDGDAALTVGIVEGDDTSNLGYKYGTTSSPELDINDYATSDDDFVAYSKNGTPVIGATQSISLEPSAGFTSNITVTVQAFLDLDGGNDIDSNEPTSPVRTVTFYAAKNVTGSAALESLTLGGSTMTANVSFSPALNIQQLDSTDVRVRFLENNTTADVTGGSGAATDDTGLGYFAATYDSVEKVMDADLAGLFTAITSATTYGAQVYFFDGAGTTEADYDKSGTAAYQGVSKGVVTTLDAVAVRASNSATNNGGSSLLREGSGSFTVEADVAAVASGSSVAGQTVTFIITDTALSSGATITAGGKTLTSAGTSISVDAVSAANGEAELEISYSGFEADDSDAFTIGATTLGASAVVQAGGAASNLTMTAHASTGDVVVDGYAGDKQIESVIGTTQTISYTVVDEFGQTPVGEFQLVISENGNGSLTATTAVSNGKATFSWVENAPSAEDYVLSAQLQKKNTSGVFANVGSVKEETKISAVAAAQVPAAVTNTANTTNPDTMTLSAQATMNEQIAQSSAAAPTDDTNFVTGTVSSSNGTRLKGVPVTLSAAGNVMFTSEDTFSHGVGSLTVYTNTAGVYKAFVTSNTAGVVTVTATSGSVSTDEEITYTGAAEQTATALAFTGSDATSTSGSTFKVTATLTDKYGNPVDIDTGDTANMITTYTGPGLTIPTTLPVVTDADGQLTVSVLLGANDTADGTVVVGYDKNGDGDLKDTGDLTATWTVDVNPVAAQKVNAGSFKGYVAVYARGYEGQRLSAKIGNDWVIVDPIVNNQENGTLFRVTDFTGAGVDIAVRIYIDRVLIDTINLTTK